MATQGFSSFVIEIGQMRESGKYPVTSFVKQGSSQVKIESIPDIDWHVPSDIQKILDTYQDSVGSEELLKLGSFLFDKLFPATENPLSQKWHSLNTNPNNDFRIILRIHPLDLKRIPWETLYDGKQFLSIQRRRPLVRQLPELSLKKLTRRNQLRILLVSASPSDPNLSPLNAETTFDAIRAQLKTIYTETSFSRRLRLIPSLHIENPILNARESDLSSVLARNTFDVICFAVHGHEDHVYLMHPNSDKKYPVSAKRLAEILRQSSLPSVVLFIACETDSKVSVADEQSNEPLAGFAHEFIAETQIPAVVAMQTKINIRKSDIFVAGFFEDISNFVAVDVAFTNARMKIQKNERIIRDTVAPILYLQTQNGEIFRRSYRSIFVLTFIIFLILMSILIFLNGVIQDTQNNYELDRETATRFQQLGLSSEFETIRLNTVIGEPIITNSSLWYTTSDNHLYRIDLDDPFTEQDSYEIGQLPSAIGIDNHTIWVSSELTGNVTKVIDNFPESPVVEQNFVAYDLVDPIPTEHGTWFSVPYTNKMMYVSETLDETLEFDIGWRSFEPFLGSGYIWIVARNGNTVVRIEQDPTTLDSREELTVNGSISRPLYNDQGLWLLNASNMLLNYDPDNLELNFQIPLERNVADLEALADRIILASDQNILMIEGDQFNVMRSLENRIQDIQIVDQLLLILDENNTVTIMDLASNTVINQLSELEISSLSSVVDDGTTLWLPLRELGLVYGIDKRSGNEAYRLNVCSDPTYLNYDGTNLWVTCPEDNVIVYGPSQLIYFGTPGFLPQVYRHKPVIQDEWLWIVQEGTGNTLVYEYDTERLIASANNVAPLLPLISHEDELGVVWTASTETGTVLRYELDPSLSLIRPLADLPPNYALQVQEHSVDGVIQSIHLIDDVLWILHSRATDLQQSTNVTLLNRHTLDLVNSFQLGLVPSGFLNIDDRVWITSADESRSLIYSLDANTGEIIEQYHTDVENEYTSWSPFVIEDDLYFMYGAPILSISSVGELVFDMFLPQDTLARLPILHSLDIESNTWNSPLQIPTGSYSPVIEGNDIWFLSTTMPVMTVTTEQNSGRLFVLDTTDDTLLTFELCENVAQPYVVGNYVLVGCWEPDSTLYVFQRDTNELIRTYEGLGSYPLQPLIFNERIIVSFRQSNNVVHLSTEDATILQVQHVGDSPSAPFVFHGQVWVHNDADGALQRIYQMR